MAMVKVTEKKFKAIKILLESGETQGNIAESMGVSACTVGFIKKAESFEDYKHLVYVTSPAYRRKKKAELKAKEEQARKEAEESAKQEESPKEEQKAEPQVQVVEHRQTVTIQATHYMMEEMKKTNELLTLISNKLAFIVDELTK